MLDFLEKIRSKSEKTRRTIAIAFTVCLALIIFSFWLVATIWKIQHPPVTASSTTESLSSSISNFVQSAQNNAPTVSF